MSDPEIRLEWDCAADIERLWEVLVAPRLWWGQDVRLEGRPGGLFHEPWRDSEGQHHTRGKVLIWRPPADLCLSWRDDDWAFETQVAFALSRTGDGSSLRLCHRGWGDAPDTLRGRLLSSHRQGWASHLDTLVRSAEQAS